MLLLEHRVLPLQCLQSLHLAGGRYLHRCGQRYAAPQHAVARFLPPPRQHERVDLQGVGHGLHFDAWQLTELHRLELELQTVPPDFRSTGSRHGHLPLGGSVYFIEARSAVGCRRWVRQQRDRLRAELGRRSAITRTSLARASA